MSVMEKVEHRFHQVRIKEMNVSELLMKYRKRRDDIKTEGESLTRDKSRGNLLIVWVVSGIEVA